MDNEAINDIRLALRQNQPPGNSCCYAKIEAMTGQRREPKPRDRPWEAVHEAFYYAMRAGGVGTVKAKVMYAAVYLGGPRWHRKIKHEEISETEAKRIVSEVRAESDPRSQVTERVTQNEPSRAAGEPATVDLVVRVTPAETTLTDDAFEKLKRAIESGDPSLDAIRNWETD